MALKYHLVYKNDMRKEAPTGAKLYYGQVRAGDKISYEELCELVSAYSLATEGDVNCILDGLLFLMRQHLQRGHLIELGALGNFRMCSGAPGVERKEDFHTNTFRKGRIIFSPGKVLRNLLTGVRYQKLNLKEVEIDCSYPHI